MPEGRVLGLDVGSKRIGIAVSDLLGITAQGLETLQRQNKRLDFEMLGKVIQVYQIREIVVGYPLRMSGDEGVQAVKMQRFAEELRERFQLPVHLWDERLTSRRRTGYCGNGYVHPSARAGGRSDGGSVDIAIVDGRASLESSRQRSVGGPRLGTAIVGPPEAGRDGMFLRVMRVVYRTGTQGPSTSLGITE
jgi:putative Holliday junction resolvase